MYTRAKKRASLDASNPLLQTGILQIVFSYVGIGHHLFVAPVNRRWKDMYATLKSQRLTYETYYAMECTVVCVPQMTLYSSVLASPSRVKLAHTSRLDCASGAYQLTAGKHVDITTLAAAHELGMPYTHATMAGAAKDNKLAEVQYLHTQGCPWSLMLLNEAAQNGYFELLRWCRLHGCSFCCVRKATQYAAESGNVDLVAYMLQQPATGLSAGVMAAAASRGRTAVCQYLHQLHCPWGTDSTSTAAAHGHVQLLDWLIDNGCPWDEHQLCMAAAQGGSVEVLAHLQQQGLLTSTALLTEALDGAAWLSKLPAAKWLREQGAEWPTAFRQQRSWSYEVLAWARAEGCTTPTV
jgi:hypothetical protein